MIACCSMIESSPDAPLANVGHVPCNNDDQNSQQMFSLVSLIPFSALLLGIGSMLSDLNHPMTCCLMLSRSCRHLVFRGIHPLKQYHVRLNQ